MPSREPTSVTQAEDEAARAQARAEEARARAIRLRQLAEGSSDESDPGDTADGKDRDGAVVDDTAPEAERPLAKSARVVARLEPDRPARARAVPARILAGLKPRRKTVAIGAGTVLFCASLVASGLMWWHHRTLVQERQHAAEFAAAARQGVMTLMSIDPNHAKEDLQHIIDESTGDLKSQVSVTAKGLADGFEHSKIGTKTTVQAVAVQSMTGDSGVVLVVAKSEITNPDNTKRQPALWRLSINLDRDGGQLKMSKVEFVQ